MSVAKMFAGLQAASFSKQSTYLEANHTYKLAIVRCEIGAKFTGEEFFVVNFEVIESTSAANPPGSSASILFANWGSSRVMFLPNCKRLLTAVCSTMQGSAVDPNDIGLEDIEAILADDGTMAAGTQIRCTTKGITTKGAGKPFTVHDYAPVYAAK